MDLNQNQWQKVFNIGDHEITVSIHVRAATFDKPLEYVADICDNRGNDLFLQAIDAHSILNAQQIAFGEFYDQHGDGWDKVITVKE